MIYYVQESCKQSHGTMLVILTSEDAKNEAKRFTESQYGMKNDVSVPGHLNINAYNAIDGSIIMDQNGHVYAIGIILDGTIDSQGNMARGARYNSAVKYLDYLSRSGKSAMVLIVSEDGSVDLLNTQ